MQIGIFAKTFQRSTAEHCLQAVREHGLHIAHYNMACSGLPSMPDVIPLDVAESVKEAATKHDVELVGLSGTFNMIHPDVTLREEGLKRLRILAEASVAIGIPVITLCTGTRDPVDKWREHPDNDLPDAWRDLCICMEKALAIADHYGVTLGIEPELANVVNSTAKARRLIDEMGTPRLSVVFDPANLFERAPAHEQRRLIDEGLDALGEYLVMAHAKDRKTDGSFCAAGQGVMDYPYYVRALRAHGYEGPLALHGLEEEEVPGCVRFLEGVAR